MLVLARRVGERIFLPDIGVQFTVLSVQGGTVRVGVEAPDEILILRDELRDDGDSERPVRRFKRHAISAK